MVLYILLIVIVFITYFWLKIIFYWRNNGIKGPLPLPIVGNFGKVLLAKQSMDALIKNIYDKYPKEKLVGLYVGHSAALLIRDPDIIKQILITDFCSFHDRGIKVSESGISTNLFVAEGDTWKTLRPKLTTIFTTKKLKEMFPMMKKCVDNLFNYIDNLVDDNIDHEVKYLMSNYTASVIGSCLFNVDYNVYSEQMKHLLKMANVVFKPSMYVRLCYALDLLFPGANKRLSIVDPTEELLNFFIKFTNTMFCNRNGNISSKKDFVDVLLQLKTDGTATKVDKNGLAEIKIDDDTIAAQVFVFYIAGIETSSGTISLLLHELALNPKIQNRVYNEICYISNKYNGEINFESLEDMTYLKMIFDETLRKYPIIGTITRKSTIDYILPESNIKIEKGTLLLIPVMGLHRDPKYFTDPDKFDPERFSPDIQKKQFFKDTYMPFGSGPRQCVGLRFGKLQSLLVIANLLKKFKIETSSKTVRDITDDPKTVTLTQTGGIWLKLSKRRP